MSPFWKNVDAELNYLGMNIKTLSYLSGVPYQTIINGRNKETSMPGMETARKIADALRKPVDALMGTEQNIIAQQNQDEYRYEKYKDIIVAIESLPLPLQETLKNMIFQFHTMYTQLQKEA